MLRAKAQFEMLKRQPLWVVIDLFLTMLRNDILDKLMDVGLVALAQQGV